MQNQFGLSESDLNDIVFILSKNELINEIILFGSRAKGNYSNGSDIDLALKGDDLKLTDIVNASLELDELYLPYKIDLIIYQRIKEIELKKHIDRVGKTLFERKVSSA